MRCARHPYEDGVGVCAPCLRDRLLKLAAEQNEASSLPPLPPPPLPEPEPEPVFPRSVSPYVCRRKSDASAPRAGRPPGFFFFRTPQVGPACGGAALVEGDIGFRRRRSGRFSVLAALFGNRSEQEQEQEKGDSGKASKHHRSWLAGIMPRGRGRKKDTEAARPPSPSRCSCSAISDRGFSPARYAGGETAFPPESPWLPSPSPLRKSPCRRLLSSAGAGVSGFAVCLSPLVRPSPGKHHRGGPPPDAAAAVSSELRPSPLHGLAPSTSLPHCRSWKLADGGRFR